MTQAETRGPGRPKLYDENELLARVRSPDALMLVRDALEANGEGLVARNTFAWLMAKFLGDATGGGASRESERRYRAALARLPEDPLEGPRRRRRSARSQRGSLSLALVGAPAAAGAWALAAASPSPTLRAILGSVPPIMLRPDEGAAEALLAA